MNEPKFRRALPSDRDAVRTLSMENKLPLDGAREHLRTFMVAHDESGLMACAGLELHPPAALVRSVAVRETHRGRRLDQELLVRLFAEALKERIEILVLLTQTAEPCFHKQGLRTVPRSRLPQEVGGSAEFRGACPESATAMMMNLEIPGK